RGEQKLNRYVGGWLRARRQLDPARYDLVHAQFGQSGLLALPKRLPLVVTFRGSDLLGIVSDVDGRYTLKGRVLQRLSRLVALNADAPLYMNACDALICTSSQEGSPNVVKEALACELPVVSVPVGDVPLRLRGIEGCEVCADDQPETLAAALDRVLRRGARIRSRGA